MNKVRKPTQQELELTLQLVEKDKLLEAYKYGITTKDELIKELQEYTEILNKNIVVRDEMIVKYDTIIEEYEKVIRNRDNQIQILLNITKLP